MDHKVKPVTYVSTDAVFRPGDARPARGREGEAECESSFTPPPPPPPPLPPSGTRGPHAEGEADLDAELPLLTTGYAQSKCVAELLVREAAKRGRIN